MKRVIKTSYFFGGKIYGSLNFQHRVPVNGQFLKAYLLNGTELIFFYLAEDLTMVNKDFFITEENLEEGKKEYKHLATFKDSKKIDQSDNNREESWNIKFTHLFVLESD